MSDDVETGPHVHGGGAHGHEEAPGHGHDAAHVHGHDTGGGHGHDGTFGILGRLLEPIVGHHHDPADSIDDALTTDARGIRALKLSLVGLGATAAIQLVVVLLSGSV